MLENEGHKERLINKALQMEPSFSLPKDFASKLALKVSKKMMLQQYLKDFLIYFSAIVGIAAVSTGFIFYFISDTWQNWIDLAKSNLVWVGGIVFIALFILFADKVLLRYFQHSLSAKKIS